MEEKWPVEHKTLAGFSGAVIVLLLVIIGVAVTMQSSVVSARGAWLAVEMSSSREQVYAALVDTIFSQRAYTLTGEDTYLQARGTAADRLQTYLRFLHLQTSHAPAAMQQQVADLEQITARLLAILDRAQRRDSAGRMNERLLDELFMQLQRELASARSILINLESAQAQELAQHLEDDDRAASLLYLWLAIIATGLFVTLAWLSRRINADMRERRAVETRLQEANGFVESLLENIPTMVFVKDAAELRLVRLNRAGETLLGQPRTALLGKSDRELFPAEQAEFFIQKDREVLALGDILDVPEEQIDTGTLGRRVLHTRKVPVRDAAGRPQFLLGISLDITEERSAQRRVLALNEELRRHAELLESSNRELESFCYSVSHDLRAPLRAINGFARLLQQEFAGRLDGEAPRYMRTICSASERMGHLIDDLLEFSRIGRQVLERETTDMRAVVDNTVNEVLLASDKPPPQIAIGNLPAARCDRRLLHLVWTNLLDNAVKYSAATAQPQISISAEAGEHCVVYCIRDNGVGFDMRYYDKLFGVFQRLHADPSYPGTGVGLAISQRIIARHGGRIWAESEPGKGARFCFSLPLAV